MFAGAGQFKSGSLMLGWGIWIQEGIRQKGHSSRRITDDKDIACTVLYLGRSLAIGFRVPRGPLSCGLCPDPEMKESRDKES